MNEILPKIEEILPILSEDLSKIETATEKEIPIDDIASEMKNFVKAQIQIAGFLMDSGIRSLSNIHETAEYYNDKLQPTLNRASQILARVDRIFAIFGKMFQSLENLTGKRGIFQPAIIRNKNFRTKISNYQATVMRASAALNRGETLSEEILGKISNGANVILQEYAEFKEGNSWKNKLQISIDKAILKANTFDEFLKAMEDFGYEIKIGKYLSFRHKDKKDGGRFTRTKENVLGKDYTKERIIERISDSNRACEIFSVNLPSMV